MKGLNTKRCLVLLLCITMTVCSFARGIAGKWTCSQDVTRQLNLGYEDILCRYKFKKDGTFVLKISGESTVRGLANDNHVRRGTIFVKGHYKVEYGKISSSVDNKDIECYAEESKDYYDTDRTPASLYVKRNKNEDSYKKTMATMLRRSLLLDYRFLWDWDKETLSLSDKELIIGEKLRCRK